MRSCLTDFLFLEAWVPVCSASHCQAICCRSNLRLWEGTHRALPSTFLLHFLHQACFLPGPALNSVQTTFLFYVPKAKISFFFFFPNHFLPTRNSCENSIRSHASGRSVSLCSIFHHKRLCSGEKYVFSLQNCHFLAAHRRQERRLHFFFPWKTPPRCCFPLLSLEGRYF